MDEQPLGDGSVALELVVRVRDFESFQHCQKRQKKRWLGREESSFLP